MENKWLRFAVKGINAPLINGLEIISYNTNFKEIIPELYADSFNDQPWDSDWSDFKDFSTDSSFLAILINEPVGFIIAYLKDGYGYISVVAVKNAFQNRGIGLLLLNQVIQYYYNNNISNVFLNVEKENIKAIEYYRHIGFKEVFE